MLHHRLFLKYDLTSCLVDLTSCLTVYIIYILCLFNNGISDRQFCLSSPPPMGWQSNFIGSLWVEKPYVFPPGWKLLAGPRIESTLAWSLSLAVSKATNLIHSATESVKDRHLFHKNHGIFYHTDSSNGQSIKTFILTYIHVCDCTCILYNRYLSYFMWILLYILNIKY